MTADDTADLDLDLVWIDQPTTAAARIDIDADPITVMATATPPPPPPPPPVPGIITEEIPITAAKKRFRFGTFLFWFGIAAIVTGAVTLVLAVRHNAGSDPDPVTTTTVAETNTTIRRTTTTTRVTTTTASAVTSTTGP